MYGNFVTYKKESKVGIVTLNRPERLNALGHELRGELNEILDEIERDDTVVAIFQGTGRAFCAGADIKEMAEGLDLRSPLIDVDETPGVVRRIGQISKVTIASVHGVAAGGGFEVALACDLRIASEDARFALPEIRLGILPGAGGTQRLPRLIGEGRAKWMMLIGEFVDAQTALQWGIVNKVVPTETLAEEALLVGKQLETQAPLALKLIKSSIDRGLDSSLNVGLEYEYRSSYVLHQTDDKTEGMRAFIEKRNPKFQGR